MPAGSGKTLIGEIDIAFSFVDDRGFYYYVWPNDEDATFQIEDRLTPMIHANNFLVSEMPKDRNKWRQSKIVSPGMIFQAVGANLSNAQRVRAYKLRMEEPHLFKPGMLSMFRQRMNGVVNATELTLSTGSVIGDESDEAFNSGSCEVLQFSCPHCSSYFTPKDEHLKWDKNSKTWNAEKNEYNWPELYKTIRYECPNCSTVIVQEWDSKQQIDTNRIKLLQSAKWERTNLNSIGGIRSFHSNFYAVPWMRLEDVAEKKIRASYTAHRGEMVLLKDYIQKILAEPWDDAPRMDEKAQTISGYNLKEAWDKELTRFLTVDVQKDHFWFVCRAWASNGNSRLIDSGRVETFEHVEELRESLGVEARRTGMDCAFNFNEVLQKCFKYNWLGLWGKDTPYYIWPAAKPGMKPQHLMVSPPQKGFVDIGTHGQRRAAIYYFWSNPSVKDLWHAMLASEEAGLTIADNASKEYRSHIASEYKRKEINRAGSVTWKWFVPSHKANHMLDCEYMNLCMASLDRRLPIGRSNLTNTKEEKE